MGHNMEDEDDDSINSSIHSSNNSNDEDDLMFIYGETLKKDDPYMKRYYYSNVDELKQLKDSTTMRLGKLTNKSLIQAYKPLGKIKIITKEDLLNNNNNKNNNNKKDEDKSTLPIPFPSKTMKQLIKNYRMMESIAEKWENYVKHHQIDQSLKKMNQIRLLSSLLLSYKDVYYINNENRHGRELTNQIIAIHVLNHCMKVRSLILNHSMKILIAEQKAKKMEKENYEKLNQLKKKQKKEKRKRS